MGTPVCALGFFNFVLLCFVLDVLLIVSRREILEHLSLRYASPNSSEICLLSNLANLPDL